MGYVFLQNMNNSVFIYFFCLEELINTLPKRISQNKTNLNMNRWITWSNRRRLGSYHLDLEYLNGESKKPDVQHVLPSFLPCRQPTLFALRGLTQTLNWMRLQEILLQITVVVVDSAPLSKAL